MIGGRSSGEAIIDLVFVFLLYRGVEQSVRNRPLFSLNGPQRRVKRKAYRDHANTNPKWSGGGDQVKSDQRESSFYTGPAQHRFCDTDLAPRNEEGEGEW